MDARPGPLDGLRVIECASIVLGPLATQYLADMGADVIKVEAPEGDLTRQIGPGTQPAMGALFLTCNRNKRSVVLDLKTETGRQRLAGLVATADVLVHSVRTEAAARLGLGYEQLAARDPGLVYCHVKGFGDGGTYSGSPAYDDVVQALSGLAALQTVVAGQPRYVPTILADKVTALHAAYAIALALLHRERTGAGQRLDIAMFETMAAFNLVEHLWGTVFEPPLAPMGYPPVATASRRPFKTLDGYLCVLPYSDTDWLRFFAVIGRPEITEDPRFATFRGRQQNVKLVWDEIEAQVATRTGAAWRQLLSQADIPHAAVNTLEDLLTDPHLDSVGFWSALRQADGTRLRMPTSPLAMSATPASLRLPPPALGAHTEQVLAELGLLAPEGTTA